MGAVTFLCELSVHIVDLKKEINIFLFFFVLGYQTRYQVSFFFF